MKGDDVNDSETIDTEAGFDPGEAWTPTEAASDTAADFPKLAVETPKLSAAKVAKALRTTTGYLNDVAGDKARADLQMTDTEAALIAPGLVKYLESRPQLAATVAAGGNEYLQASFGLAVYGVRVTRQRAANLEAEAAAGPDAVGGFDEPLQNDAGAVALYPIEQSDGAGATYGDE